MNAKIFLGLLILSISSFTYIACSKDKGLDVRYKETIVVDGITRTYIVRVPFNYHQNDAPLPLVIGMHGVGGSGEQFEKDYDFSKKADESNFIAVYPDGVQKADGLLKIRSWNAGGCCDYAMNQNINDVKFIQTLIEILPQRFRINSRKIYVVGMSNGGMMAYRLATELSHKIAAAASVSGNMMNTPDSSLSGPIPILHIHSKLDTKVPFSGGVGIGEVHFKPAEEGLAYWRNRNNCLSEADSIQKSNYTIQSWKNSDGKIMLQLYLTVDGGHSWPGAMKMRAIGDDPSQAIKANDVIWDFFKNYELP